MKSCQIYNRLKKKRKKTGIKPVKPSKKFTFFQRIFFFFNINIFNTCKYTQKNVLLNQQKIPLTHI